MEYKLIRSNRKTLVAEIDRFGNVIVRAPMRMPLAEIERFLTEKQSRIESAVRRVKDRQKNIPEPQSTVPLAPEQIDALYEKAKAILPGKIAYYGGLMNLHPTKITITAAEKRFGSCSSRGHVCFSYRLMLYPDECIDYVVVHELAHLRHMNHSKEFYALVASILPDWKRRQDQLRGIV